MLSPVLMKFRRFVPVAGIAGFIAALERCAEGASEAARAIPHLHDLFAHLREADL